MSTGLEPHLALETTASRRVQLTEDAADDLRALEEEEAAAMDGRGFVARGSAASRSVKFAKAVAAAVADGEANSEDDEPLADEVAAGAEGQQLRWYGSDGPRRPLGTGTGMAPAYVLQPAAAEDDSFASFTDPAELDTDPRQRPKPRSKAAAGQLRRGQLRRGRLPLAPMASAMAPADAELADEELG